MLVVSEWTEWPQGLIGAGMPEESLTGIDECRPSLIAFLLGSVEVEDVLAAQRRLIYELEETGDVALILCEHEPALTIGRSGSHAFIRPAEDETHRDELQPRFVSRGGGCWLHTSGQLAGYLIGDLKILAASAPDYLRLLQDALSESMADFDIRAEADPNRTGLFVGQKRILALGVSVVRDMVHFGFLLNVGPHLRPFDILEEPGFDQRTIRQTSMEAVRSRPVSSSRLRASLIDRIREGFRLESGVILSDDDGTAPLPEVFRSHVSR